MGTLSSRGVACEIVAALMKAPRTRNQLAEVSGVGINAVDSWLKELAASGLVYRLEGKPTGNRGPAPVIFALQPYPYAIEDYRS